MLIDKNLQRIDQRYFGSRLAGNLKTRKGRRRAFMFSIAALLSFGYLAGFASWAVMAPNAVTPLEKILSGGFWVVLLIVTQLEPLLYLAVRSAIEWPGQPYDERQQQLFAQARSDAYPYILILMGLVIVVGLVILIAVARGQLPFSHPTYGGIHILIGISLSLMATAKSTPYLLLAWQLPDEPGSDGDFSND